MKIIRTRPDAVAAPSELVTGAVHIDELAAPTPPSRVRVGSVRFAPGARTHWHRHPLGQVLHVTEGAGLVQRRGGPVEPIGVGDTVRIEPGEWHWHGAGATTPMTHLVVQEAAADGTEAEVDEAVTDAEYAAAPAS
ncbi:cupin domain-containing protein [Streptomyces sp. HU2014]|uniref:(R)-mandelonitrile lyase n=1 Tax=Streptomyces sp. HU2014 TaxID=2939414 RepID=UPI00200CD65D|nr:cupin domain-containing protein [Streptomyces sp. HU2014]UQI46677.1 cupin domain-containing protein [Streptomyces sp. HU2014]